MAAPIDNSLNASLRSSLPSTGEGVVIDIGTGDGLFVYQSARQNPKKFYIGIDANPRPLAKVSEKIHRKPAKGGTPNVLFVQAAVEELPEELQGLADEVHVHFPWGSLLKAFASAEVPILQSVRRICAPDALLEVVVGLDPGRDQSELRRLGLKTVSINLIDEVLQPKYRTAGFEITERGSLSAGEWPEFKSSWAKRLKGNDSRPITYIIARTI